MAKTEEEKLREAEKAREEKKGKGTMTVHEAGELGGHKGGERTAETHGHEFYKAIGHKGGQKVKELIKKGEEEEARK
jgi:general stress protein YciG